MPKALNMKLNFQVDTTQARSQLTSLQNQLTSLTRNSTFNLGVTEQITEATKAAQLLKQTLKEATDIKTGSFDLSKFTASMNENMMTLQKFKDSLTSLGPAGEKAFNGLATTIASAQVPLQRTNKLASELWNTFSNTIRWQLTSQAIHKVASTISQAFSYAQNLDKSLNNIQIVTGHNADYMAKFAQNANKAAQALSASTLEYSNAALIYYQQGLSDKEVSKRVETTVKLAKVTGESTSKVSQQMTAVWNNFSNGLDNLERYADVMTALGATTASSSSEIAKGLEKFAAISNTIGLSYDYAATALATVTAQTRQSADQVGTSFKTLFSRLESLNLGDTLDDGVSLSKYSQALAKVGVNVLDVNGQLKNMDTILDDLGAKWDSLNQSQRVALAQTVGGVRNYTQLIALMDNWSDFQENLITTQNATGTLQAQADIYAKSWEAAQQRVTTAAQGIYDTLISSDFFKGVNNLTAGLLNGLGTVGKSLGTKGSLAGLGMLFNSIYGDKLAKTINDIGNNIVGRTAYGQAQATQVKLDQLREAQDAIALNNTPLNLGRRNILEQTTNAWSEFQQQQQSGKMNIATLQAYNNQLYDLNAFATKAMDNLVDVETSRVNYAVESNKFVSGLMGMRGQNRNNPITSTEAQNIVASLEHAATTQGVIKHFADTFATDITKAMVSGDNREVLANIEAYRQGNPALQNNQFIDQVVKMVSSGTEAGYRSALQMITHREGIANRARQNVIEGQRDEFLRAHPELARSNATRKELEERFGAQYDRALANDKQTTWGQYQQQLVANKAGGVITSMQKEGNVILGRRTLGEAIGDYFSDRKSFFGVRVQQERDSEGNLVYRDALGNKVDRSRAALDANGQPIPYTTQQTQNMGSYLVQTAQLMNSFAMASSSISNFAESVKAGNASMTGFISAMGSTAMFMGQLTTSLGNNRMLQGFMGSGVGQGLAGALSKIPGIGQYAVAEGGGLSTTGATLAIAGVMAAIKVIGEVVKVVKANSIDAKIERANEDRIQAQAQAKEDKQKYDTFLSTVKQQNESYNKLATLQAGTAAYTSQLIASNEQAREIIDAYNLKAQQDYTIDKNGAINFTAQQIADIDKALLQTSLESSARAQLATSKVTERSIYKKEAALEAEREALTENLQYAWDSESFDNYHTRTEEIAQELDALRLEAQSDYQVALASTLSAMEDSTDAESLAVDLLGAVVKNSTEYTEYAGQVRDTTRGWKGNYKSIDNLREQYEDLFDENVNLDWTQEELASAIESRLVQDYLENQITKLADTYQGIDISRYSDFKGLNAKQLRELTADNGANGELGQLNAMVLKTQATSIDKLAAAVSANTNLENMNLTKITELVTEGNGLSIQQTDLLSAYVSNYGTIFGKETGEYVFENLFTNGRWNEDFFEAISNVSADNSISGLYNLKQTSDLLAEGNRSLAEPLKGLQSAILADINSRGSLATELFSSSEFQDVFDSLKETYYETGQITTSNIAKLASKSDILHDYIQLREGNYSSVADMAQMIFTGQLAASQISAPLMEAIEIAGGVANAQQRGLDTLDEQDLGTSYSETDDYYQNGGKAWWTAWHNDMFNDAPLVNFLNEFLTDTDLAEYNKIMEEAAYGAWTTDQVKSAMASRMSDAYAALNTWAGKKGKGAGGVDDMYAYLSKQGVFAGSGLSVDEKTGKIIFNDNFTSWMAKANKGFTSSTEVTTDALYKSILKTLTDSGQLSEAQARTIAAQMTGSISASAVGNLLSISDLAAGSEQYKTGLEKEGYASLDELSAYYNAYRDRFQSLYIGEDGKIHQAKKGETVNGLSEKDFLNYMTSNGLKVVGIDESYYQVNGGTKAADLGNAIAANSYGTITSEGEAALLEGLQAAGIIDKNGNIDYEKMQTFYQDTLHTTGEVADQNIQDIVAHNPGYNVSYKYKDMFGQEQTINTKDFWNEKGEFDYDRFMGEVNSQQQVSDTVQQLVLEKYIQQAIDDATDSEGRLTKSMAEIQKEAIDKLKADQEAASPEAQAEKANTEAQNRLLERYSQDKLDQVMGEQGFTSYTEAETYLKQQEYEAEQARIAEENAALDKLAERAGVPREYFDEQSIARDMQKHGTTSYAEYLRMLEEEEAADKAAEEARAQEEKAAEEARIQQEQAAQLEANATAREQLLGLGFTNAEINTRLREEPNLSIQDLYKQESDKLAGDYQRKIGTSMGSFAMFANGEDYIQAMETSLANKIIGQGLNGIYSQEQLDEAMKASGFTNYADYYADYYSKQIEATGAKNFSTDRISALLAQGYDYSDIAKMAEKEAAQEQKDAEAAAAAEARESERQAEAEATATLKEEYGVGWFDRLFDSRTAQQRLADEQHAREVKDNNALRSAMREAGISPDNMEQFYNYETGEVDYAGMLDAIYGEGTSAKFAEYKAANPTKSYADFIKEQEAAAATTTTPEPEESTLPESAEGGLIPGTPEYEAAYGSASTTPEPEAPTEPEQVEEPAPAPEPEPMVSAEGGLVPGTPEYEAAAAAAMVPPTTEEVEPEPEPEAPPVPAEPTPEEIAAAQAAFDQLAAEREAALQEQAMQSEVDRLNAENATLAAQEDSIRGSMLDDISSYYGQQQLDANATQMAQNTYNADLIKYQGLSSVEERLQFQQQAIDKLNSGQQLTAFEKQVLSSLESIDESGQLQAELAEQAAEESGGAGGRKTHVDEETGELIDDETGEPVEMPYEEPQPTGGGGGGGEECAYGGSGGGNNAPFRNPDGSWTNPETGETVVQDPDTGEWAPVEAPPDDVWTQASGRNNARLPGFASGKDQGAIAVTGELGPELRIKSDGSMDMLGEHGREYAWVDPSDRIYTASQTASILSNNNIPELQRFAQGFNNKIKGYFTGGDAPGMGTQEGSSGGSGDGGGGDGGGAAEEKDPRYDPNTLKIRDILERYYTILQQIDDITRAVEHFAAVADRAWGVERTKAIEKQSELIKDQIKAQEKYVNEIEEYLTVDESALTTMMQEFVSDYNESMKDTEGFQAINWQGAEFDENGVLTNYRDFVEKLVEQYNQNAEANAKDKEAQYKFQEQLKDIQFYTDTLNLYESEREKLEELRNNYLDTMVKKIVVQLEYENELDDNALVGINYQLNKVKDNAWRAAEAIDFYAQKMDYLDEQNERYKEGIKDILATYSGNVTNGVQHSLVTTAYELAEKTEKDFGDDEAGKEAWAAYQKDLEENWRKVQIGDKTYYQPVNGNVDVKDYFTKKEISDVTLDRQGKMTSDVKQSVTAQVEEWYNELAAAYPELAAEITLEYDEDHFLTNYREVIEKINEVNAKMSDEMYQLLLTDTQAFFDKWSEITKENIDFQDITTETAKQLESMINQIYTNLEQKQAYLETMMDYLGDSAKDFSKQMNSAIDEFDYYGTVLDSYENIINLTNRRATNIGDEYMKNLRGTMLDNSINKLTSSTTNYNLSKTNLEQAQKVFDTQKATYQAYVDSLAGISEEQLTDDQKKHRAYLQDMVDKAQENFDKVNQVAEEAHKDYLKSWEDALSKIAENYKSTVEDAAKAFEDSFSPLFSTFELLQAQFDREKALGDLYVDNYQTIHDLNKLDREINQSILDTDNLKSKARLRDLQKEINDLQKDGTKLSAYDLDILDKKYKLELARQELEDAKNAKSLVRLSRDNNGNWSYVYTANEDEVDEAEQRYEDAIRDMEEANQNYIDNLEAQILQVQQQAEQAIQALSPDDFATYDEYLTAVSNIQDSMYQTLDFLRSQLNNAFGNNEWLDPYIVDRYGENDHDLTTKWDQMTIAAVTGINSLNAAVDTAKDNLGTMIDAALAAYVEYSEKQAEVYQEAGHDITDAAGTFQEGIETMAQTSTEQIGVVEDLATRVEEAFATTSQAIQDNIKDIYDEVRAYEELCEVMTKFLEISGEYVPLQRVDISSQIDTKKELSMIREALAAYGDIIVTAYDENNERQVYNLKENDAETARLLEEWTSKIEAIDVGEDVDTRDEYDKINEYLEAHGHVYVKINGELVELRKDNEEDMAKIQAWLEKIEEAEKAAAAANSCYSGDGCYSCYTKSYCYTGNHDNSAYWSRVAYYGYDTGGYTGRWQFADTGMYTGEWPNGSARLNGRLAWLHQKELVLNAHDTENFLDAMQIVRELDNLTNWMANGLGDLFTPRIAYEPGELEQNVHIDASFPNVTDHNEIEQAFGNLVNLASQYANRK